MLRSVSYVSCKMIAWEFLGTLPCVAKKAMKKAMKKRYVVLSSFHTLSSRDCSAIQPRRKERSSAQYMIFERVRFWYRFYAYAIRF